jgi:outer membrane protein assembly factor BamB
MDRDGSSEVICVMDDKLKILSGNSGSIEEEAPLPSEDARDCIVIGNFSGHAYPQDVLVKNRYGRVWALDRNLEVMWSHEGNTGHYPWPHDFDGDGRDELMCGFALLGHNGARIWEAKLPGHSDATAVGEVDGNTENGPEVALATCGGNTFALLSAEGKVLWRTPCGHSQHIVIGDFCPEMPGKELAALDRGRSRTADGTDAMVLYTARGKQVWREKRTDPGPNRWITVLTTVCDWDGQTRDLILAYRRGGSIYPTLYDGQGEPVATFPFPEPSEQHFAQHADLEGDAREEIVVWNENWVYIYGNAALCPKGMEKSHRQEPNKRLYNYTHYIGMP